MDVYGLVNTIVHQCKEKAWRQPSHQDVSSAGRQEDRSIATHSTNAFLQGTPAATPGPSSSTAGPNMEELLSTSNITSFR